MPVCWHVTRKKSHSYLWTCFGLCDEKHVECNNFNMKYKLGKWLDAGYIRSRFVPVDQYNTGEGLVSIWNYLPSLPWSSLQSTLGGAQFSTVGPGRRGLARQRATLRSEQIQLQALSTAGEVVRIIPTWFRAKGKACEAQHNTLWWHDDRKSGSKCCWELWGSWAGCQHGGNLSAGSRDPDTGLLSELEFLRTIGRTGY